MRRNVTIAGACVLLFSACAASAQDKGKELDSVPDRKVSLTVSGGVSLGNYQAGSAWAMIFVLKNHDRLVARHAERLKAATSIRYPRYLLDVLTGASAGNANALLSGIEYCRATVNVSPEKSLFWRAWVPVGFRQLTRAEVKDPDLAAFSREAFAGMWDTIDAEMRDTNRVASCNLLIGITSTKLSPDTYVLTQGLSFPVQRVAGVFRLVSDTVGLAYASPRREHVLVDDLYDVLILEPEMQSADVRIPRRLKSGDVSIHRESIQRMVEASGAFPMAFAPRVIKYQMLDSLDWDDYTQKELPCRRMAPTSDACDAPRTARFVDGGIFDNRPMGLALGLSHAAEGEALRPLADTLRRQRLASAFARRDSICALVPSVNGVVAPPRDSVSEWFSRLQSSETALAAARASQSADTVDLLSARVAIGAQLEEATERLTRTNENIAQVSAAHRACVDASNRAANLVDSTALARAPQLPWRLLYYIDDEARRTDNTPDSSDTSNEPVAGVSAALRVLSKGFETGQNMELRAFANRVEDQDDHLNVFLGVNSRYPRLMAEHLNHFGAFLSRTFREYDFYAGVYDGLRSAFREQYCRIEEESLGQLRPKAIPTAATDCEVRWLQVSLDTGVIDLSPEGRAVIERMLAHERAHPTGERLPNQGIYRSDRERFLVTLVDANVEARRDTRSNHGSQKASLVEQPLYEFQLVGVMRTWKRLLGKQGLQRLCEGPSGDRDACDIVREPDAVYHNMLLTTLQRMRKAEYELDKRDDGKGHRAVIGLPLYLERAYNEQFRSCAGVRFKRFCSDPNPTTSDVLGGWWYRGAAHLLPGVLAVTWDGRSRWAQWKPTTYIKRFGDVSTMIHTPVEAIRENDRGHGAIGIGFTAMPASRWLTSASLTHLWVYEAHARYDLSLSFAAGVLRVGIREDERPGQSTLTWKNLTVGVGDANGIGARAIGGLTALGRWLVSKMAYWK